jgi:hypothetical protein
MLMSTSAVRLQRIFAIVAGLVMVLALISPTATQAQKVPSAPNPNIPAGTIPAVTLNPVRQSKSPALMDIPIRETRSEITGNGATIDSEWGPYMESKGSLQIPRGLTAGNRAQTDGNASTPPSVRVGDDPMPAVDASWNGLNQGANRTLFNFGVYPPDTNGDSSMTHYIETVNSTFAIWDYTQVGVWGGWPKTVYGPAGINTLFTGFGGACEFTNDGDPIVLYDEHADRWLISQFALPTFPLPPFSQCIAISATGNPLGAWYRYEYQFDKMNDYPHFGIWQDAYYMTINQFEYDAVLDDLVWGGQGVVAFNRSAMLKGAPASMYYWDTYDDCTAPGDPTCYWGGMLPADNDGFWAPAGSPGFVMQFDDDFWGYSPDQLQYSYVFVDWSNILNTFMTLPSTLGVNPFDSEVCAGYARNCIPQPGTAVGLDTISDRLMYRLQYRNFGSYQTMVVNQTVDMNDPAGHAGVRWYELRDNNDGLGWVVYQQGDFAPDAAHRWMGSIAMDASGNIALGYSVSDGTSIYPSIRYAGRLATSLSPLGVLDLTEGTIWTGGGSQTGTAYRWGDYSSMSVLPDGCTFVYANEYLRGTTPAEWYTSMGMFDFDANCVLNSTASFKSQAARDGFLTESGEFSGLGGSASVLDTYIKVGDTAADRQVKGLLSFNTSSLPDTAVITNVRVEMRYQGKTGTNPYDDTYMTMDIQAPFFGAGAGLAPNDFQAASDASDVAYCSWIRINGWYACSLVSGFGFINPLGTTQFRLGFGFDDNDDLAADNVRFFSSNYFKASYRPVLIVEYYVP